jgi:hypothetical protein
MTSFPADDFASTLPQSDPPRRLHNLPKASNFSVVRRGFDAPVHIHVAPAKGRAAGHIRQEAHK